MPAPEGPPSAPPTSPPSSSSSQSATSAPARPRWLALLALVVLPLALRLAPIGHGLPATTYVPDTHVVRGALGMAKDKTLVPPSSKYTSYPYLLPYLLLPIYAGEYAVGRATGAWGGAGEFGMKLLEEPERAHLPARILVALFGALTPLLVFALARASGMRAGAWIAAWLTATSLLHVHFSLQERPWVPMTTFLVLAAWGAAVHVTAGAERRGRALLWSWVAAGLALATHQGGAFALGIPGLAWLLGDGRPGERTGGLAAAFTGRRLASLALGLAVFAAVTILVGHPYYLIHGAAPESAVSGGGGGAVQLGGQGFTYRFRTESVVRMAKAFAGYDPALLVLGLAGLVPALRRRATVPATVFALVWGFVFLTNYNDHVRYLLPFVILLAPAAGIAGERLWSLRSPLRFALVPLLALPLVQAARLGYVIARPDTRAEALERLAELQRTEPGARVAIDLYGPDAPLDLRSLERLAGWRDLYSREEHRRLMLEAGAVPADGPGLDAVRVEDMFTFNDRKHSSGPRDGIDALGEDPNAIFRALGVTHVLLVDRDPGDGAPPLLLDQEPAAEGETRMPPLVTLEPPLWTVSPGRGMRVAREARLPTELEFPLVSLWQVARPGPRLSLVRLPEAPR